MRYLILLLPFLLTGCGTSDMGKAKQDYICRDEGGVYVYVTWISRAYCRSGKRIDHWSRVILPEEYMPQSLEK